MGWLIISDDFFASVSESKNVKKVILKISLRDIFIFSNFGKGRIKSKSYSTKMDNEIREKGFLNVFGDKFSKESQEVLKLFLDREEQREIHNFLGCMYGNCLSLSKYIKMARKKKISSVEKLYSEYMKFPHLFVGSNPDFFKDNLEPDDFLVTFFYVLVRKLGLRPRSERFRKLFRRVALVLDDDYKW